MGSSEFKITTLLYCFNEQGEVLLMLRLREPNKGLWSPPGGKLEVSLGESPYQCAQREAHEEIGLVLQAADLHLTGIVSEQGFDGAAHWLMFLFEVGTKLGELPAPHPEGRFAFHKPENLHLLDLPVTDREQIWPFFWKHRFGFFSAHCRTLSDGLYQWELEESRPAIVSNTHHG